MSVTLAADIVRYLRTQTIGNEQQGLATFYTYMSAHLPNKQDIQSAILTGSRSSGKTKIQRVVSGLLPNGTKFHTSAGSPKSFIYDEELKRAKYLVFSELQKLTPEWIEFLKSMSGDDPDYMYRVTQKDRKGNWIAVPIKLGKKPYTVTCAQDVKDVELMSRLLTIPTDESADLNKAVAQWQLGFSEVEYEGITYRRPTFKEHEELRNPIIQAVQSLVRGNDAHNCPDVIIPHCFASAAVSFLDVKNVNSRRHAKIVASLMKASALIERQNRRKTLFGNKIHAGAQDLLNVITLQPVLRTTILDVDDRARMIYEILESNNSNGLTAEDVQRAVTSTTMSSLSLGTIRSQLKKLADHGAVEIDTGERGKYIYYPAINRRMKDIVIDYDAIHKEDSTPTQDPLTGITHGGFEDAIMDIKKRTKSLGVKKAQGVLNGF